MRAQGPGMKSWLLSALLLLSCPILVANAEAAGADQNRQADQYRHAAFRLPASPYTLPVSAHVTSGSGTNVSRGTYVAGKRGTARSYGISCVPYARAASGIQVAGNAWQWWSNAEGRYARGDQPEAGSVLNFRANNRMHLGHVAVVTRVVNAREVIIDHANWPNGGGPGGVSRAVSVVDVSEANNWSAVRVELGRPGTFGSVYPAYGFIYNRPDTGLATASIARPAPQPDINPARTDLRPVAERPWHVVEEVAEAPAGAPRRIDLSITSVPVSSGK
jgi:hypothetical protein